MSRKKRTSSKKRAGLSLFSNAPASKTRRKSAKKPARRRVSRRRKQGPFWEQIEWQLPDWAPGLFGFTARVASFCLTAFLLGLLGLVWFGQGLPRPDMQAALDRPPRITVLDKNNEVITVYGTYYGELVNVGELPPHVVQAFIATEDRNFYHHLGVNPLAIGRALLVNAKSGALKQGGSTITQQVAKNLFLTSDKTLNRKAREVLISFWLELNYSKDDILGFYLNNSYFGAGAYGLEAAAQRYFDKSASLLSIGEAAMLAGLLKAPSRYAPTSSPDAAEERARIVLSAMGEAGFLTPAQVAEAKTGPVAKAAPRDYAAAYAVDYTISQANEILGAIKQDIVIKSTFDLAAHRRLEPQLHDLVSLDAKVPAKTQAALVAMEHDGAIRVLIGGRDFAMSEFNRAVHARRQPGSAFKPFVYLAAMEDGIRPDDMVIDAPVELGDWKPDNYKGKYYGAVTLTEALSRSLNAAAISLQETVGREHVIQVANRFDFNVGHEAGAAMALGVFETTPLELVTAYAAFANQGVKVWPYSIQTIRTEKGELLYDHKPGRYDMVSDAESIVALNHMLKAVVDTGSGRRGKVPGYATFGKTGTTQDSRDAWFAGHAGGLAGVVWLGLDDNRPMGDSSEYVSGSGAPAILWSQMMTASLNGRPDVPFEKWEPKKRWRFPFPFLSAVQSAEPGQSIEFAEQDAQDDFVAALITSGDNSGEAVIMEQTQADRVVTLGGAAADRDAFEPEIERVSKPQNPDDTFSLDGVFAEALEQQEVALPPSDLIATISEQAIVQAAAEPSSASTLPTTP